MNVIGSGLCVFEVPKRNITHSSALTICYFLCKFPFYILGCAILFEQKLNILWHVNKINLLV